jgi:hypothetical protein
MLILFGVVIVAIGVVLMFSDRIPFLGKLPGDITIRRENYQIHVPVMTSIILSVLISVVLWVVSYIRGK